MSKAAGPRPSRTEGVYLPPSSNCIDQQSGWTKAQPYGGGLSPSVNLIRNAAGLKPSRTEGVHLPPQEVYLPPPCPNRTEGACLLRPDPAYGGDLSPYVQQRN